jgi:hypothetical protein
MKKKIVYILSLFIFAVTSCSKDYLDRLPLDQISDETFWKTEKQLMLAVNGCYGALKGRNTIDMEWMADNAFNASTPDLQVIGNGNFGADLGTINSEWRTLYAGIRQCNVFLENYQKAAVPNQERKEILAAEVRVIRAYLYGYLALLWGDVPLVTKPLDIDELYEARTPVAEVQNFIFTELDAAAAVLPKEIPAGTDLGRIRKGAALGLKARLALYYNKYDVAEKAAKDVMDLGVYSLFTTGDPKTSYNSLFTYAGKLARGNNKETILARLYLDDLNTHNVSREAQLPDGVIRFNPTKSLVDDYLCVDGLPIAKSPLYAERNYQDVFTNRDPRMVQTVLAPGSRWGGRFDGNPGNTNPDIYTAPKFRSDRRGAVTTTGYYFTKYVEPTTVGLVGRDANDTHILRYGEILLTYAEARLEQGKLSQDDIDRSINLLRDRVGMKRMVLTELAANAMNVRDELHRERRIELALEGQRYFDIKRWKIGAVMANDLKGMKKEWALVPGDVASIRTDANGYIIAQSGRTFTDRNYLWPVPQIQLDRNPALGKNPGW